MKIQYTGIADRRILTEEDWTAIGLSQGDTEWSAENDFTAEVKKESGEWLLVHDPEFRVPMVEVEDEEAKPKTTKKAR